jgi:flagellar biosynthetic protein FliR
VTPALIELVGIAREGLAAALAVFLRVGAVMALIPAFGEAAVPMRVRLALTVGFTLVVAPAVAPLRLPADDAARAAAFAAEVAVGLCLGLALRLMVLALQTAAAMAAQASSLMQILGASAGAEPQPAIGHVLTLAGLALAVAAGLHLRVAEALIASYALFPAGTMPDPGAVAAWGSARVGAAFALAFTLAAPFLAASLVYNVALGVINRAMPQLMVAFVGAPAMTLGGLALLLLAAPALIEVWRAALHAALDAPFGTLR